MYWLVFFVTNTIKRRVFMFRPKASVKIATLKWAQTQKHTLARYAISYQWCYMKNNTDEILECDQKYALWNTIGKKGPYLGKQKHTPLPETKVRIGMYVFPAKKRLVLVFKMTFCWDILSGVLCSCFLTPGKSWVAVLVRGFSRKTCLKVFLKSQCKSTLNAFGRTSVKKSFWGSHKNCNLGPQGPGRGKPRRELEGSALENFFFDF
jgi:hypothetical protein